MSYRGVLSLGPLLQGDKVYLGPIEDEDLPVLSRWFRDTVFLRQLDARTAHPRSAAEIAEWLGAAGSGRDFLFAVRPAGDSTLVGFLEIDGILWNQGVCGLSLAVGTPYRGRGFGREALALALNFAFYELNLRRVQLTVFSYNRPAIGLYHKLGFTKEGTYREFVQRDGEVHDMYLYGMLRREWDHRQDGTQKTMPASGTAPPTGTTGPAT